MKNHYKKTVSAILICIGIVFNIICSVINDDNEASILDLRQLSTTIKQGQAPIIYTFFDDLENVDVNKSSGKITEENDRQILKAWEEAWSSLGYIPKILTMEDARRNPEFEVYSRTLDSSVALGSNVNYDKACFLRWIAMSTTDGGMFSDFDVIPLTSPHPEDLVSPERFTLYQGKVPSLMRGTKEQWNTITQEILKEALDEKNKEILHYSDMFGLRDLINNPNKRHLLDVRRPHTVVLGSSLLEKEWKGCYGLAKFRAVHFQHYSEQIKHPWVDELLRDSKYESRRAGLMSKWPKFWPTYYDNICPGIQLPQPGLEISSAS